MQIREFYKSITDFAPYQYQLKVAELLLSGENVILSVPTGAGKTWASVMPFLYAKQNELTDFPQKMIYSLPLRTLTNSIFSDINETLKKEHIQRLYPKLNELTSRQTGEYSEDPFFEKEMMFTTIDQTLSNFLCFPLALSQRQANINAGSLVGSYLVFDEFHLLDPKLSMATTLGMIRMLKNLCRVCIMTATLTNDYIQFIKKDFNFKVVSIEGVENNNSLRSAPNEAVKKAISVCLNKKITAQDIFDKHTNKTIVICNRVETAQNLYAEIEKNKNDETILICIHSRYFDSHRKHQESMIKEYFGKNSTKKNAILIATQVIEAGMDISCDTMHTEISPINSFLQRAGRCARFANEYGKIFIYDVLDFLEKEKITIESDNKEDKNEIRKLSNKYLPYDKDLCQKSLVALSRYNSLNEAVSNELVNSILQEDENHKVENIMANLYNIHKIRESWRDCNKNHYRETIRDIQSIELVLMDLGKCANKKVVPWRYETISVFRWSFISWVKQIMNNKQDEEDWVIARAVQEKDNVFDFEWQDKGSYFLSKLSIEDLKNHFEPVFVSNKYFDYTSAGFILADNNNCINSPVKENVEKEKLIITYKKDTFYQHNKAILNCFKTEFKQNLKFVFKELEEFLGAKYNWEKLMQLTICLHDYGKLNTAWQRPMKKFQRAKTGVDNLKEVLAHTEYNDSTDIELAKECQIRNKPAHAGIGAMQAYDMVLDEYDDEEIARVISNAILKHHSPDSKSYVDFSITDLCINEIQKLFKEYSLKGNFIKKERGESLEDIALSKDKEWILYFLFVRILRICDQKATESFEKYFTL